MKIEQKVNQILQKMKDLPLSESRFAHRPKTASAKTSRDRSLRSKTPVLIKSVENA